MKLKIKKDDEVKVTAGAEKGKSGKVMDIQRKPLKIRVQGIAVKTIFDKKERKQFKKEAFIDYSNVSLIKAAEKKTKKRKIQKTKPKNK